jgi:hypothetical protein
MKPEQTQFPGVWLSIELAGYRDHPEEYSTYSLFSYESLPPLANDLFRGDFQWLKENSQEDPESEKLPDPESKINRLVSSTSQIGLNLPDEFVMFMSSSDLRNRIRSCTDCYFDLSDQIVEYTSTGQGYLIRFLSDSQGCLFWYLYLTEAGEHCVVVSPTYFGCDPNDEDDEDEDDDDDFELEDAEVYFCAPGFEEFLYRFWIENEIWYALSYENKPLTREQEIYVEHYKTLNLK